MVFTDIRLQNYRSYKDASFELGGGVSIVVGPNGAGKSNMVEAMLLVANGRLYRGRENIVNHKSTWARIDVHTGQDTTRTVKIRSREGKTPEVQFDINKRTYKRLPNPQKQPAVLFEPNNLGLMHGEPQARREYLDSLSAELNDGYRTIILSYRRALAQRNALLKTPQINSGQLFVWNVRLSELAEAVVKRRLDVLEQIGSKLPQTYSGISGKKTKLDLRYETKFRRENYSADLMKALENDIEKDSARGFTGSGPHREDFSAYVNGQPVATTASRGETRSLLLALKVIELGMLEDKTGSRPLLLLDDVFSELDNTRRKALTGFLSNYQTVITTTDADIVLKNFSQNCQIIPI
ncbi:MAG TPA: DNA replication and repair protein RecF [Candidatus Saccharimonadales bacterium]|nr:DNA replication and repair protein RecF [Candidatus Saccharimonadales bacterium]